MRIASVLIAIFLFWSPTYASQFFARDLPTGPEGLDIWTPSDMVSRDVSNDGENELVIGWRSTVEGYGPTVVTYRWIDGGLQEISSLVLSTNYHGQIWVYLEDADTDGDLELITVEGYGDGGSPVTIHEWEEGAWTAGWSTTVYSVRRSDALAVGDIDGDAINEIALAIDWYDRSFAVIDYDSGLAEFSLTYIASGNDFRSASIADVNNDGLSDIVAGCGNWSYYDGRVYSWNGSEYELLWDSPAIGNVSATTADHNGDGIADIVLASFASSHVSGQNGLHVYSWQNGGGVFEYLLSPDIPLIHPKALDFDNDGIEDLVAIAKSQDEPGEYFGDGLHFYRRDSDHFVEYEIIAGLIGLESASVDGCDLDNDGFNEILMANADPVSGATGFWLQHVMDNPFITSIEDVPLDNGRQVRVCWSRSSTDNGQDAVYTESYRIWREVKDGLKRANGEYISIEKDVLYELVGSSPAMGWDQYALVVPTLADEGEVSDPRFGFIVTAHLSDGRTYYTSPSQQGFSIDQTAPAAPENLFGSYASNTLDLGWEKVETDDLAEYLVYQVVSGAEMFLGSTAQPEFRVADPDFSAVYRVSAVDRAGNESEKAEIGSPDISGAPDGGVAELRVASLTAYPNPFNPRTTVYFSVPSDTYVRLTVYDVAGRRVRDLTEGMFHAGEHAIDWNGEDRSGRVMACGTYIVRLETEGHEQVQRVTLVK